MQKTRIKTKQQLLLYAFDLDINYNLRMMRTCPENCQGISFGGAC